MNDLLYDFKIVLVVIIIIKILVFHNIIFCLQSILCLKYDDIRKLNPPVCCSDLLEHMKLHGVNETDDSIEAIQEKMSAQMHLLTENDKNMVSIDYMWCLKQLSRF